MENTIENANQVLATLINKSVVEGQLTIAACNALNFLIAEATQASVLKKRVEELENKDKK